MNETIRDLLAALAAAIGISTFIVLLKSQPDPFGWLIGGFALIVFLAIAAALMWPKWARVRADRRARTAPTPPSEELPEPFIVDEPWIELHTSAASSPTHVVLLVDPDRSAERDYIDEVWAYSPNGHRRTFYRKSPQDGGDSLAPTLMGPNNPPPASVRVRWTDDRGVHEKDVVPHETYSSGT